MGKTMFSKWEKYWTSGSMLLAIACVLDPRCKMAVVEYYFQMLYPDNCDNFVANLVGCLNSLFKEYLDEHSKSAKLKPGSSNRKTVDASSTLSGSRAGLKDFMKGKQNTEPVKTDIENYLSDQLDQASLDEDFDILAWWKVATPKYPILSQLTRDILAVLISTVASEASFSTGGRTLSSVRNCLNDQSLEALICAQDWLKASVTDYGGCVGDSLWTTDKQSAGTE